MKMQRIIILLTSLMIMFMVTGTVLTDLNADPASLSDNFSDGNMDGWSVIDEGTTDAPSNWNVQDGRLHQSSNIFNSGNAWRNRGGTFAYWNDPAALLWTDYTFDVTIKSTDNDGIGVMFRYQDPYNYYKYDMDKQRSFRRLFRMKNGVETTLKERGQVFNLDKSKIVDLLIYL